MDSYGVSQFSTAFLEKDSKSTWDSVSTPSLLQFHRLPVNRVRRSGESAEKKIGDRKGKRGVQLNQTKGKAKEGLYVPGPWAWRGSCTCLKI